MTEEVESQILERYELIQKLGKGAYGIVWKAMDKKYKQVVALKKVFEAFRNSTDAQRTYREVVFLQDLNGHDNIVRLRNIIKAENNLDLYLVFEYMEADLHLVIRANILADVHRQYIIYQLLKALKYVHSAGLIHRDLKPANILINSDVVIKVADFGLARSVAFIGDDGDYKLSEYVATRWYRAPEILLGSSKYSKAVDMWSVGCILGELLVGKPIFQGKSSLNQIEKVLELVGKPKPDDLESIESPHAETIINSLAVSKKKTFQQFFPDANEDALDLLRKLLTFNPHHRITVEEALKHKYVIQFSSPEDEIVCKHIIEIPLNDFMKLSTKEYREAIYANIAQKKRERRKKLQERSMIASGNENEKQRSPPVLHQQYPPQQIQQHPQSYAQPYLPQYQQQYGQQPPQSQHSQQSQQSQHIIKPDRPPMIKSQSHSHSQSQSQSQIHSQSQSISQSQLLSKSHAQSPTHSQNQQGASFTSVSNGVKIRPSRPYERSISYVSKTNPVLSSSYLTNEEKSPSPVPKNSQQQQQQQTVYKVRQAYNGKTEGDESPEHGAKHSSASPQRTQVGRKTYYMGGNQAATKNIMRTTGMGASKVLSTSGNSFILKKK